MQPIAYDAVREALAAFAGKSVYLHLEVTPGGFARNLPARVEETFLNGEGPYRAALRCAGGAWIRFELLTDYEIDAQGRLLLAAHDEEGKLTRLLELSLQPFPAGGATA